MNSFRETLVSREKFALTFELIPARGSKNAGLSGIMKFAEEAAESGMFDGVSLTDNPGGSPACSPDTLAREIRDIGLDTIVHLTAKDGNRNSLESRALALDRSGVENLLAISGDYPVNDVLGVGKPVFDFDSTQLIRYLKRMNGGLQDPETAKSVLGNETSFFVGCAVSAFKTTEPELMMQYYKLEKKIAAGADFVICQFGYDMRKYQELIRYMNERDITVPLLGSVFVLRRFVGRMFNQNKIPGCVVSDELLEELNRQAEAPDKGKGDALERAARQVAILKGIGYSGAHIEGMKLTFGDVRHIIERSREIGDDWAEYAERVQYSPSGSFFLYGEEKTPATPKPPFRLRRSNILYQSMRAVHYLILRENTIGFRMMKGFVSWLEKYPKLDNFLFALEQTSKIALFDCRNCGDCALPDMQYLCPESQCPKFQRIGPCGGSRDGVCEVHEDRFCVWYHIYLRAVRTGEIEQLRKHVILPRNWSLYETSSWGNYYQGRDHAGKEL